jgi:hypothetical protein
MAAREPRYVATFRPGTPEMMIVAGLVVVGAIAALAISLLVRQLACGLGHEGCTATEGFASSVFALAGVFPALGMFVASARRRGHPWRWFVATAFVYFWWGLVFAA